MDVVEENLKKRPSGLRMVGQSDFGVCNFTTLYLIKNEVAGLNGV